MAQVTEIRLVDDLDEGPADETVEFGIDGRHYEIDLSSPNAEKLRDALAEFIRAGRRRGTNRPKFTGAQARLAQAARTDREQNQHIREWAWANGYENEVGVRGRIKASVVEDYHAHKGLPKPTS